VILIVPSSLAEAMQSPVLPPPPKKHTAVTGEMMVFIGT
jgi:hypothetical protein